MAEPPRKRFKFATYNEKLKDISVSRAEVKATGWDNDDLDSDDETQTPFTAELSRLSIHDLTVPYQRLSQQIRPLSTSLPILIHNIDKICDIFYAYFDTFEDDHDHTSSGLASALSLLQTLYDTCLGECARQIPATTRHLLRLGALRKLEPSLVERTYSTLSHILRILSTNLVGSLLQEAWDISASYLRPTTKLYIRRCVSNVWVGVVRKARSGGLSSLMDVLLGEDVEGTEILLAECLKGAGKNLHSRAVEVFGHLLARMDERLAPVLKLVVVATCSHCSSTTIEPLIALLQEDLSTSHRLDLLTTAALVRSGKRFPQSSVQPILSKLQTQIRTLPAQDETFRASLKSAVIALLLAGQLAHWLHPGVAILEELWRAMSVQERYAFAGCLIQLKWPGTEQFLIPHIAKTALESIHTEPLATFALLNRLAGQGFLHGGLFNVRGGRWRSQLSEAVLAVFKATKDDRTLCQILRFIPHLSFDAASFASCLVGLVCVEGDASTSKSGWKENGPYNSAHKLASVLRCMASLASNTDAEAIFKAAVSLPEVVDTHGWNREVLAAVADLADAWSTNDFVAESLYPNLISSDSDLRKSTLRLLARIPSSHDSIWAACLKIEMSEISLRNIRERTTEMSRLARLLESSKLDSTIISHVLQYLLSQFKIGFRPIWSETASILSTLASSHGQAVWDLIFGQLEALSKVERAVCSDLLEDAPEWASRGAPPKEEVGDEEVDEAFRDRNVTKALTVMRQSAGQVEELQLLDREEVSINGDRLDALNYEAQLLSTLVKVPSLAEKHTRDLCPLLFQFLGASATDGISRKQMVDRAAHYLELFAKFSNPKAAYRSADLHQKYLELLSGQDIKMQRLALDCLMTYRSSSLTPYDEDLRAFLDDEKFRDNLIRFKLGQDGGFVEDSHREELIPITIRLLYGILTARRNKSTAHSKRQAILTALRGCNGPELGTFVDLMLDFGETPDFKTKLGFLGLLADVLKYTGDRMVEHWPRLLQTTINMVHAAQESADVEIGNQNREIRLMGTRRLVEWLNMPVDFDFEPFLPSIYEAAISPKLEKLDVENSQSPSATLDLIVSLAKRYPSSLAGCDARTIPKLFDCLAAVKVKSPVVSSVFDVIDSLLPEEDVRSLVLLPNLNHLLEKLIPVFDGLKQFSHDVADRFLSILSQLSGFVSAGASAQRIASLLSPLLRGRLSEKSKVDVLSTLGRLYPLSPDFNDPTSKFFAQNFEILTKLLQTIYAPTARKALAETLQAFAGVDTDLQNSLRLTRDLNAYALRRLDEPDFDTRLGAFAEILEADVSSWTQQQWLPILRTCLFGICDPEELSIRSNASSVLQKYVALVGDSSNGPYVDTLSFVILPGLRKSLQSKTELVRNEALQIISYAVKKCNSVPALTELQPLLTDDDETNFFSNITHIQLHRRARALHRLGETATAGLLKEQSVFNILLPTLEHILNGATDLSDHNLINEAIIATGAVSRALRWSRYLSLVLRHLRLGSTESPQQKIHIRTVSSIIDNFAFDVALPVQPAEDDDDEEEEEQDSSNIYDAVTNRLLPALSKFIQHNEKEEDIIRIPVALATVKVAAALPEKAQVEIMRTVTIVSQILRNKEQDTRDLARETTCKIAVYLGPKWLNPILQELGLALQRGPQKHVLAVTTHSILVAASGASEEAYEMDEAVAESVRIAAEVVWGQSGDDVKADGFKTKMREVKGSLSRGYDTFQLVATLASPLKLGAILAPLREVMHHSQAVKTMQNLDEALRRIALGLNANKRVEPADVLNLCYSLVSGNSQYLEAEKQKAARVDRLVEKSVRQDNFYHLNAHKFVAFGLDLFVTAFRRGKFAFDDVETLSRLGPLVPAMVSTLNTKHSNVLNLALKAVAAIIKCPVPQVEANMPLLVTQVFRILENDAGSESAQTALRTLAVIIRDCNADISPERLKYLLEMVSPDLEDPDRQAAIFAVLKAVVSRKLVVPEIYDLMDRMSSIMVTSQSTHIQSQCRGVLMQFLLDYPQGSKRLKQQMSFFAQNLEYVFESGRISVMEILALIFAKFSDDLISEYANLFFAALVVVLAKDDSEKCRIMASALIGQLVERMDAKQRGNLLDILRAWIGTTENDALAAAALRVMSILLDAQIDLALSCTELVAPLITASAAQIETEPVDHSIPYEALTLYSRGFKHDPSVASSMPWEDVISHLVFPHDWVRVAAARAIASLFPGQQGVLDEENSFEAVQTSCLLMAEVIEGKLADQLVKLLWNIAKHWAAIDQSKGLTWLMSRMSFIARGHIVNREEHWSGTVMAILRFFAGIFESLDVEQVKKYLVHSLAPVYRILDEGGELRKYEGIDELRALATEVRDFVQSKVGTTEFSHAWESLRQETRERRETRREENNRMALTDPAAWAEIKEKKNRIKKESKKRKIKAFKNGELPRKRKV